ncbi:S-layer glycoprotein N-glycosyltransferase AglJ [Halobaculum sp. CBA1158]|uniref:S-layer glycoprotein N-glycosyltransferase AglJ n=1 Tax=Halobaculum sp. CBA1158 TaxID=2904243 RepID=UPI001F1DA761|nr:S-layer glycoprotein N-glycosyltransferase AglJ [Halobaculum sp. CBA1158]UIP01073.1 S-layer glycoprotein N-glycosyltransferase AglJ [Halobaculum sp. CBA1158]
MTDDVCVLLPTYDEAATVADVVTDFREHGLENVLVIDGGSTDDTRELAREAGARVEIQSGSGKGQAIREAVREHVTSEYVLMADADGTYRASDAEAMLEPLREGTAEHVIGDRFADMREGAMTRFNRLGNAVFNGLFSVIHREDYGDILSGYRAFTVESFERLRLAADGFGIETELAVECARHGVRTTVVPITYLPRPSGSNTNLHPVKDGGIILMAIYRQAKTSNPLFYFGSAGVASGLAGTGVAAYVAYDWFVNGIPHNVLAIVAGVGLILGVQLLIFGVLSDLVVTLHGETLDRVERLEREVDDALGQGDADSEARESAEGEPIAAELEGKDRTDPPEQ